MKRRRLIAVLLLILMPMLMYAHGGMIHVMGTVTALTDTSITVETTDKKSVQIALTTETTFQNGSKLSAKKDLKIGDRVVIHAASVKGVLQAHEVRFTEGTTASSH